MILIIDDDRTIRLSMKLLFTRAGYEVETAERPEEALEMVRRREFDLIFMDMNYSISTDGTDGLELLRKVRIFQPDTPVILITAWGSIDLAVEGMRLGAFDFLTKPIPNRVLLQRAETAINLSRKSACVESSSSTFDRCGIIGENPVLTDLLKTVERIAPTDAPVLILGENGTGKELIANAIHANSKRREEAFVKVNLGGVARSLFESELFGHVKGAFTGAVTNRKGSFELADKGTIFLDEIGELGANEQVKLLRTLQEHTFQPLGDSRARKTDIRVVCATNADLRAMVSEGTFREDLLYRINLITLRLPALRERRDDIPLLVRHFLKTLSERHGVAVPEISSEAMTLLTRLPYLGNIRELRNIIERAVLIAPSGRIDADLLADSVENGRMAEEAVAATATASGQTLEEMERNAIVAALQNHEGNLSKAALSLGITRQSLYRRMEKLGIKP